MSTQAVIAQINIYQAINNIKRNIGAFLATVNNSNGTIITNNSQVLPSGTVNYTPPAGNAVTIISCSAPLTVTITPVSGSPFVQTITSLMYVDYSIASLSFTNPSSTLSPNLIIING